MSKAVEIPSMLLMGMMLIACSPEKQPIDYGNDNCHYCNMTIVDKRYGSEVVTNTGKVYKFDAVECMLNFFKEGKIKQEAVAMQLVNTYDQPGELHKVTQSYYLRSRKLPSPMGLYITPFSREGEAGKVKQKNGGKIYSWKNLKAHFDEFSRNINSNGT